MGPWRGWMDERTDGRVRSSIQCNNRFPAVLWTRRSSDSLIPRAWRVSQKPPCCFSFRSLSTLSPFCILSTTLSLLLSLLVPGESQTVSIWLVGFPRCSGFLSFGSAFTLSYRTVLHAVLYSGPLPRGWPSRSCFKASGPNKNVSSRGWTLVHCRRRRGILLWSGYILLIPNTMDGAFLVIMKCSVQELSQNEWVIDKLEYNVVK